MKQDKLEKQVKEQRFAKKMGWNRIGDVETDIKITLTDTEKIKLGGEQSDALLTIRQFEDEKSNYDKDIKGKIAEQEQVAHDKAILIRNGYRIEMRMLSCFLDPDAGERVYVDLNTGEEAKHEAMREEDRQMRL